MEQGNRGYAVGDGKWFPSPSGTQEVLAEIASDRKYVRRFLQTLDEDTTKVVEFVRCWDEERRAYDLLAVVPLGWA